MTGGANEDEDDDGPEEIGGNAGMELLPRIVDELPIVGDTRGLRVLALPE
jgi:hypothetical protein